MPSTYSSLLRLELQATGENASTWGDKANTVFQRIEEGITGVLALAIGTSVSAPVSLTYNNGSSDQARNAVLNVTGQLASSVPIHVSAVAKKYWIFNQTSGQSLQFGVVGRTAVTLASGWNHIVTDGSASFLTYSPPASSTSAVTEASADSRYAHKTSANVFTAQNTFQSSVLTSGAVVFSSIVAQTGPITSPPSLELDTNTAAFASVTIGGVFFSMRDLVSTKVTAVAGVQGYIESAAALSVQSRLDFITKTSNTTPRRVFSMGKGLFAVSASGGDMGLGTVNAASTIYVNGDPVLTSATLPAAVAGSVHLNATYFVSSSTWTVPAAVSTAEVWTLGGGGGGGGGTTGNDKAAGGGGGGGLAFALISVTPGESLTITVGTSGAGGNTSGSSGSAGGTTSVLRSATPLCRATGGSGGTGATSGSPNAGGAGGAGTVGDLLIVGTAGSYGYPIGVGNVLVAGRGGASTLGGAPADYISATRSNGADGSLYGAGGSGAAANSGGASTGGNGAPGCVIVRWSST